MKEKLLKIFSSNIKIRVSGKNINNFIKKLVKNNISVAKVIPRNYKEVDLIINYNDLEKIERYKTIYDVEIIRYYGKLNIIRLLKKNIYIISFLVLSFILIYILSNMIFSIEIIHSNSKIVKVISEELTSHGIRKYSFIKDYNELEKIEKEILEDNKDSLEWLEIIREGTKYIVRAEERIINKTNDDNKNYNIVSSKNAVIKTIEAQSGEKVKEVDTYVKKGDIIISSYVTLPNNEKVLNTARGKVTGEVWYTVDISYPYYYNEVIYTGKKKKVISFNFLDKRLALFDFNKYKNFDRDTKYIFKSNIIPMSLTYEYQYETKVINEVYTYDEAKEKAKEKAEEKLKEKYHNIISVENITITNESDTNGHLNLSLFITVLEDITEYQEIQPEENENIS